MNELFNFAGGFAGAFVAAVGFLYTTLRPMRAKLDEILNLHHKCREELPQKYVPADKFWAHSHTDNDHIKM